MTFSSPIKTWLLPIQVAVAAAAGLLSHWTYFIRGEHHMQAPLYFRVFLVSALAVYLFELRFTVNTIQDALIHSSAIVASYVTTLFSSIVVYRLFFHRTRHFPGPRLLAATKLWHSWQARHSQNHLYLEQLHKKYGGFIRTGPREITVFHPAALEAVHGNANELAKPDWYDLLNPEIGIVAARDKRLHDARRKVWNPSFSNEGKLPISTLDYRNTFADSTQALKEADLPYAIHLQEVIKQIDENVGKPVNIGDLLYWWACDVVGELMFSRPFGALTTVSGRYIPKLMRGFTALLGPCSPVPWLGRLGFSIPYATKGWNSFVIFCKDRVNEQLEAKEPKTDIVGRLISSSRSRQALHVERDLLDGDTVSGLIAGSDTTPCLLTYTLTHLAKTPVYQDQILAELRAHNIQDPWDGKALQNLPFLNALVNETLRLHSPLPTSTVRETGSEGICIAGTAIPPKTIIVAPRWNIARSPSVFTNPTSFMPERWLPGCAPPLHDTRGFMPFGAGRYQCIGRNLAMRQSRIVIAVIVSLFHVALADGESGEQIDKDMIDHFTAVPGPVELCFRRRAV